MKKNIADCFLESRVRGFVSVCEETGLSPEQIALWLHKNGAEILYSDHKGLPRFFCRLPDPKTDTIPNIFDE